MYKSLCIIPAALLALLSGTQSLAASDSGHPVVIELFTSQGCSSCPPADALLRSLSDDTSILPLSLHVHYWDDQGWKDPYSSQANTDRQRVYAKLMQSDSLFTPQAIVNGIYSAVGSYKHGVDEAIKQARSESGLVPITLTQDADKVTVHVSAAQANPLLPNSADIIVMKFVRNSSTVVTAGENSGNTLQSINSVTEISHLGTWQNRDNDYEIPFTVSTENGIAIVIQAHGQGRIIGAASL